MSYTIDYYNNNAHKFIGDTVNADMNDIQKNFLMRIPKGGSILDLGCGSGRDSKAFLDLGYKVVSVDGSIEMCKAAEKLTKQPVICSYFQDFETGEMFDGIWACASLLHLHRNEIKPVVIKLAKYLKENACLYMSFKLGDFQGERNGRYFTDFTLESISELLSDVDDLKLDSSEITSDVRPGRDNEKWLNVFYVRV